MLINCKEYNKKISHQAIYYPNYGWITAPYLRTLSDYDLEEKARKRIKWNEEYEKERCRLLNVDDSLFDSISGYESI